MKKYGRPAGYGFVIFESIEGADKALTFKDVELEGRQLNVEKVVPREGDSPRRDGARGRGRGRRGGRFGNRNRRSGPPTGEPSKTVVFVGNMPFNVIDQDLLNIFADFKVENAHVVRRFDGASRGFGFVTLANEEEQARALQKLSNVYIDERKLTVRPALSTDGPKNGETQHDIIIKSD